MHANNIETAEFAAFAALIDALNHEMGKRARETWHQKELKNEFIRVIRAMDAGENKEAALGRLRDFLYSKGRQNTFFDVDAVTSSGNVLKYLRISVSPEMEKLFAKYFADGHGMKIMLENLHHAIDKQSDEDIERLCQRVRGSLQQFFSDISQDPEFTARRADWFMQALIKVPDDYRAMSIFIEREKDPQGVILLLKEKMADVDEFKKRPRAKTAEPQAKRHKGESAPKLFEKSASNTLIKQLIGALRMSDLPESQPILAVLESISSGGKIPDLKMMRSFASAFQGLKDGDDIKEMVRDICFPNTSILERNAELTPYYATMLINSIDRNQSRAARKVEQMPQDQEKPGIS